MDFYFFSAWARSDIIAAGAASISILAAVYARWAALATENANTIALHSERLAIYKGLIKFRSEFSQQGYSMKDEALWAFKEHVFLSEFYFNDEVHSALSELLNKAGVMKAAHALWQSKKSGGRYDSEVTSALRSLQASETAVKEMADEVVEFLKPMLQVGKPRTWII